MKPTITQRELEILDLQTITAGGLRDVQDGIIDTFAVLLEVDDWDEEKENAIAAYVRGGGREHIETFLADLGVGLPLTTDH